MVGIVVVMVVMVVVVVGGEKKKVSRCFLEISSIEAYSLSLSRHLMDLLVMEGRRGRRRGRIERHGEVTRDNTALPILRNK